MPKGVGKFVHNTGAPIQASPRKSKKPSICSVKILIYDYPSPITVISALGEFFLSDSKPVVSSDYSVQTHA